MGDIITSTVTIGKTIFKVIEHFKTNDKEKRREEFEDLLVKIIKRGEDT